MNDELIKRIDAYTDKEFDEVLWGLLEDCRAALSEPSAPDALIAEAVAKEREVCAKVVEDYCGAWDDEGYALATAIRARGQK